VASLFFVFSKTGMSIILSEQKLSGDYQTLSGFCLQMQQSPRRSWWSGASPLQRGFTGCLQAPEELGC